MSYARLPPLVDLNPGKSPSVVALGIAAYASAIAAVWLSGLPWRLCIPATVVLAAFCAWWINAHALRRAFSSVRRVVWQPEGECILVDRRGRTIIGSVLPGIFVSPVLVVFRTGTGLRRRTLVIAGDAVDGDAFRRLRMRLNVSPPLAPPSLLRRRTHSLQLAIKYRLARGLNQHLPHGS